MREPELNDDRAHRGAKTPESHPMTQEQVQTEVRNGTSAASASLSAADKAIAILSRTNDGDDLAPFHLSLLELAVNIGDNHPEKQARYAEMLKQFDELHAQVIEGGYRKPWLCGVENLTRDHEGYVYWRGSRVEHFSHRDYNEMRTDAQALAERCTILEGAGLPVTWSTAVDAANRMTGLVQMTDPKALEWAHFLVAQNLYTCAERRDKQGNASALMHFWVRPASTGPGDNQAPRQICTVISTTDPHAAGGHRVELDEIRLGDPANAEEGLPTRLAGYYHHQERGFRPAAGGVAMDAKTWMEWTHRHGFEPKALTGLLVQAATNLQVALNEFGEQVQALQAARRADRQMA